MANEKNFVREIADIREDFPRWYTDVVIKTELVDYGPVKGTMVIRPYGYAIWENIQKALDERIKATGHKNAYFPLLIPYSFLTKEAEHVEGFAPEVAVVTYAGGEELSEKLVIRPTSETIFCEMYSKWVNSYRDLPMMLNQWANVMRWEKTTRPFLRSSEFLWQEGHTLHATQEEAEEETLRMLRVYEEFAKNILAMPVLVGRKTDKEKFAGGLATYSMEAMMLDGKSLQAGTTHYFGQNFAKPFNIRFLDSDGTHKYPHETSWGVSTRLIGALIMAHGDERGLCLPPKVAPIQIIIIPIAQKKPGVIEKCRELKDRLMKVGIRAEIDESDNSPGWKFNQWEMKGVPCRFELGPRDIENGVATVSRRDSNDDKFTVLLSEVEQKAAVLLKNIHDNMYQKALAFLTSHIVTASNMSELENAVASGNFALTHWCGETACEDAIKEKMQATSRNMPFDQTGAENGKCVCCGKKSKKLVYFGKAY